MTAIGVRTNSERYDVVGPEERPPKASLPPVPPNAPSATTATSAPAAKPTAETAAAAQAKALADPGATYLASQLSKKLPPTQAERYDQAAEVLTGQGLTVLRGPGERNVVTVAQTSGDGTTTSKTQMFWTDDKGKKQFREYDASGPVVGGVNPPAGAIASLNASGPGAAPLGGVNVDPSKPGAVEALQTLVAPADKDRFAADLRLGSAPTVRATAPYSKEELAGLEGKDLEDARLLGLRPKQVDVWSPVPPGDRLDLSFANEIGDGGGMMLDPRKYRQGPSGLEEFRGTQLGLDPDQQRRLDGMAKIPKDLTGDQLESRYGIHLSDLNPAVQAKMRENPRLTIAGLSRLTTPGITMGPWEMTYSEGQVLAGNGRNVPGLDPSLHVVQRNSANGSWLSVGCEGGHAGMKGDHHLGYMGWDDRFGLVAPNQAYMEINDDDGIGGLIVGAVVGVVSGGLGLGAVAGGALGGAASAAVNGGDVLQGALGGAVTGGLGTFAPGLSEAFGGGLAGDVAAGAVLGGTGSALTGGDPLTGALSGGVFAGGRSIFRDVTAPAADAPTAGADAPTAGADAPTAGADPADGQGFRTGFTGFDFSDEPSVFRDLTGAQVDGLSSRDLELRGVLASRLINDEQVSSALQRWGELDSTQRLEVADRVRQVTNSVYPGGAPLYARPMLELELQDPSTLGYLENGQVSVGQRMLTLDGPNFVAAVVHEEMHAFQHGQALAGNDPQSIAWRANFPLYIDEGPGYWTQPVEAHSYAMQRYIWNALKQATQP